MKSLYTETPNGYQESIRKGLHAVKYLSRTFSAGKGTKEERIARLKNEIRNADAIVIGAGAGLSTAAGLTYSGPRFEKYFLILQRSTASATSIPAASIPSQMKRPAGPGGQDTFITTAILIRRSLFIKNCFPLYRVRIIL